MMVIGGRTNQVGEVVPLEVYDTESSEWYKFNSVQRFRHSCWSSSNNVYVHGGFEHEIPNIPLSEICKIDTQKLFVRHENLLQKIKPPEKPGKENERDKKEGIKKNQQGLYNMNREFKLANQAHIATQLNKQNQMNDNATEDFSLIVRQISIDKLAEEPKKLNPQQKNHHKIDKNPHDALCQMFLKPLLKPKEGQDIKPNAEFPCKREHILELVNECTNILAAQPIVIKEVRPPTKIIGDIHGQYIDLMRFFDIWKAPIDQGDIHAFDYVFLGNYVDKGQWSLEVICLLFVLKLKFPKQIILLRGNHEDRHVNKYLGLGDECAKRLGEDINDPNSVFAKINDAFDQMPLAAIINDKQQKILCVHGGIGPTIQDIEGIEAIPRPFEIKLGSDNSENQQKVIDLLWSDPHETEEENGFTHNFNRDPQKQNNIVNFGPDNLNAFFKRNNLNMMIRGHSVCPDGIERYSDNLITVTSCTNHSNIHNNDACILVIQKKLIISPKIIKPLAGTSAQNWMDINVNNISQAANSSVRREPTPPRKRQQMH
jgi:diadenosine tetraphosphatase ApaH/serine/threonine PP2A family protein phosphatase